MGRWLTGLLLVVLGVVFLLNQLGLTDFAVGELFSTFWPVILIVLGVNMIVNTGFNFASVFLLFLGILFQLQALEIIQSISWNIIWPFILIWVGLSILFPKPWWKPWKSYRYRSYHYKSKSSFASKKEHASERHIESMTAFGRQELVVGSSQLAKADIVSIFGSSKIDVTRAQLENHTATFDLVGIFGSHHLIVPKHWKVTVQGVPIFGSVRYDGSEYTGTRHVPDNDQGSDATEKDVPLLHITYFYLFGNLNISRV